MPEVCRQKSGEDLTAAPSCMRDSGFGRDLSLPGFLFCKGKRLIFFSFIFFFFSVLTGQYILFEGIFSMFNKSFQFRYIKTKLFLNLKLQEELLSPRAQATLIKERTSVSAGLIAEFVPNQLGSRSRRCVERWDTAPRQTRLPEPRGTLWGTFPAKRRCFGQLKRSAPGSTLTPSGAASTKLFFHFNKSKQVDMLFLKHCSVPQWSEVRCSSPRRSRTMPTALLPTVCPLPQKPREKLFFPFCSLLAFRLSCLPPLKQLHSGFLMASLLPDNFPSASLFPPHCCCCLPAQEQLLSSCLCWISAQKRQPRNHTIGMGLKKADKVAFARLASLKSASSWYPEIHWYQRVLVPAKPLVSAKINTSNYWHRVPVPIQAS